MTTTPKGTTMPTDPNHRALLRAIDGLTTQVRRIADTLTTPVADDDLEGETTTVHTPNLSDRPIHIAPVPDWRHVTATMRENEQLRTELARINTRPDPNDGNISLTIGEQLAMAANLEKVTAAIDRVRSALDDRPALCTDSVYERGWNDATEMVRHALAGPTTEG